MVLSPNLMEHFSKPAQREGGGRTVIMVGEVDLAPVAQGSELTSTGSSKKKRPDLHLRPPRQVFVPALPEPKITDNVKNALPMVVLPRRHGYLGGGETQ